MRQAAAAVTVGTYCYVAVCRHGGLGGTRRFGTNRGKRGAGHIVAAARLQLVFAKLQKKGHTNNMGFTVLVYHYHSRFIGICFQSYWRLVQVPIKETGHLNMTKKTSRMFKYIYLLIRETLCDYFLY